MSGIYIPGLSMPTSCYDCSFSVEAYEGAGFYNCVVTDNCVCKGEGKHDDCPLVPVPPHGRLIDGDALCKKLRSLAENEYTPEVFANWIENHIDTIVSADKEGEG